MAACAGRRRRSCCTKCGRSEARRFTRPTAAPSWSARIRFVPTTRSTTPSACCTRKCAGSARSSCALPTQTRCRPAALWRSTVTGFPRRYRAAISAHPLIELRRGEITLPPDDWDSVIIATGPLTSPGLATEIGRLTGEQQLAFFDAIAPIVHRDSIDLDQAWFQSRYDKAGPGGSGADYINCPLTHANSMKRSSRPCSPPTRPASMSGKVRRPISTAACRSRSWPSAAPKHCGMGR